jgi:hypothetical protein
MSYRQYGGMIWYSSMIVYWLIRCNRLTLPLLWRYIQHYLWNATLCVLWCRPGGIRCIGFSSTLFMRHSFIGSISSLRNMSSFYRSASLLHIFCTSLVVMAVFILMYIVELSVEYLILGMLMVAI